MTYRLALPGERYAYKRVKSDAAAARREFEIPFEWFAAACHLPCHYCGRVDQNKLSVRSRSVKGGWVVKDFKYNGLDRKDNSKGYTIDNCVPCCAVCNRGKNSMVYNEWEEYIDTLVAFRLKGDIDDYQGRHVRSVPFPVSERGSETGYASKVERASGGYVSEDGTLFREHEVDCFVPWSSVRSRSFGDSINSQEEEPEQECTTK